MIKNLKKSLIIFSIILILIVSCGMASAAVLDDDNTDSVSSVVDEVSVSDSNNDVELIDPSGDSASIELDEKTASGNLSAPVSGNTFKDIQDAIDAADDGDTIELSGTYTGNGTQINVTKSVTIMGAGETILDANNLSRIFYVKSNYVTLKNLNFRNAKVYSYGEGGAVYSEGNLNISSSSFINCKAESGYAIISFADTFINNSIFKNCFSEEYSGGGTISIEPYYRNSQDLITVSITNSIFENNYRAIVLSGLNNVSLIENCNFTNNLIGHGAISSSSFINIFNCNFINNTAKDYWDNEYYEGGAVRLGRGALISNCNFINNTAASGGAIYTYGNTSIVNSNFEGNIAKSQGSDIYNKGNLSLSNNTLVNDYATIYNSYFENYAKITSPVSLIILDNSTRIAYKGNPFTVYAKLVDADGNLIEDDRIHLNLGSDSKSVFFNKKNSLFEYTLNNMDNSLLVSGFYDGALNLDVKTGYILLSDNAGGEIIVPVIANGTIDFITNDEAIAIFLKDNDGKAIPNAILTVNNNGVESNLLTNNNGQATVSINGNTTLKVNYADNNGANVSSSIIIKVNEKIVEKNNTVYVNQTVEVPVYINNTIEKNNTVYIIPNRTATKIIYENMTTTSVNSNVDGRIGEYFEVTLQDAGGKALANKTVYIGFNGKVYERQTDKNGGSKLQINLGYQGDYTFAIAFLGDDNYTGSFEVAIIKVNKQTPKLTATSKTYTSTAKTKALTATLISANGHFIPNKKISFTLNGKTYTGLTNSRGVASVNVSLNKKGTYSFVAKYAGDGMYQASSASNKFIIK